MSENEMYEWMFDLAANTHVYPEKDDRYMGIYFDHKSEIGEILTYGSTIDLTARSLGIFAGSHKIFDTDFLYVRFWQKTIAEYHLYRKGVNLFHDFKPLKSWILVGIEWDHKYEKLLNPIENIS